MSPGRTKVRPKDIRRTHPTLTGVAASEDLFAPGRYFDAVCPSDTALGDWVRVAGARVGGLWSVQRVSPMSAAAMPAIGVVIEKPTSTTCLVHGGPGLVAATSLGAVLTPGRRVFIGRDGRTTMVPPAPETPGELVLLQVVGTALDTDQLLVAPGFTLLARRG